MSYIHRNTNVGGSGGNTAYDAAALFSRRSEELRQSLAAMEANRMAYAATTTPSFDSGSTYQYPPHQKLSLGRMSRFQDDDEYYGRGGSRMRDEGSSSSSNSMRRRQQKLREAPVFVSSPPPRVPLATHSGRRCSGSALSALSSHHMQGLTPFTSESHSPTPFGSSSRTHNYFPSNRNCSNRTRKEDYEYDDDDDEDEDSNRYDYAPRDSEEFEEDEENDDYDNDEEEEDSGEITYVSQCSASTVSTSYMYCQHQEDPSSLSVENMEDEDEEEESSVQSAAAVFLHGCSGTIHTTVLRTPPRTPLTMATRSPLTTSATTTTRTATTVHTTVMETTLTVTPTRQSSRRSHDSAESSPLGQQSDGWSARRHGGSWHHAVPRRGVVEEVDGEDELGSAFTSSISSSNTPAKGPHRRRTTAVYASSGLPPPPSRPSLGETPSGRLSGRQSAKGTPRVTWVDDIDTPQHERTRSNTGGGEKSICTYDTGSFIEELASSEEEEDSNADYKRSSRPEGRYLAAEFSGSSDGGKAGGDEDGAAAHSSEDFTGLSETTFSAFTGANTTTTTATTNTSHETGRGNSGGAARRTHREARRGSRGATPPVEEDNGSNSSGSNEDSPLSLHRLARQLVYGKEETQEGFNTDDDDDGGDRSVYPQLRATDETQMTVDDTEALDTTFESIGQQNLTEDDWLESNPSAPSHQQQQQQKQFKEQDAPSADKSSSFVVDKMLVGVPPVAYACQRCVCIDDLRTSLRSVEAVFRNDIAALRHELGCEEAARRDAVAQCERLTAADDQHRVELLRCGEEIDRLHSQLRQMETENHFLRAEAVALRERCRREANFSNRREMAALARSERESRDTMEHTEKWMRREWMMMFQQQFLMQQLADAAHRLQDDAVYGRHHHVDPTDKSSLARQQPQLRQAYQLPVFLNSSLLHSQIVTASTTTAPSSFIDNEDDDRTAHVLFSPSISVPELLHTRAMVGGYESPSAMVSLPSVSQLTSPSSSCASLEAGAAEPSSFPSATVMQVRPSDRAMPAQSPRRSDRRVNSATKIEVKQLDTKSGVDSSAHAEEEKLALQQRIAALKGELERTQVRLNEEERTRLELNACLNDERELATEMQDEMDEMMRATLLDKEAGARQQLLSEEVENRCQLAQQLAATWMSAAAAAKEAERGQVNGSTESTASVESDAALISEAVRALLPQDDNQHASAVSLPPSLLSTSPSSLSSSSGKTQASTLAQKQKQQQQTIAALADIFAQHVISQSPSLPPPAAICEKRNESVYDADGSLLMTQDAPSGSHEYSTSIISSSSSSSSSSLSASRSVFASHDPTASSSRALSARTHNSQDEEEEKSNHEEPHDSLAAPTVDEKDHVSRSSSSSAIDAHDRNHASTTSVEAEGETEDLLDWEMDSFSSVPSHLRRSHSHMSEWNESDCDCDESEEEEEEEGEKTIKKGPNPHHDLSGTHNRQKNTSSPTFNETCNGVDVSGMGANTSDASLSFGVYQHPETTVKGTHHNEWDDEDDDDDDESSIHTRSKNHPDYDHDKEEEGRATPPPPLSSSGPGLQRCARISWDAHIGRTHAPINDKNNNSSFQSNSDSDIDKPQEKRNLHQFEVLPQFQKVQISASTTMTTTINKRTPYDDNDDDDSDTEEGDE